MRGGTLQGPIATFRGTGAHEDTAAPGGSGGVLELGPGLSGSATGCPVVVRVVVR